MRRVPALYVREKQKQHVPFPELTAGLQARSASDRVLFCSISVTAANECSCVKPLLALNGARPVRGVLLRRGNLVDLILDDSNQVRP